MQNYKLTDLRDIKNIIKNKKLYTFQNGGLDVIPEGTANPLNLQELQIVESSPTPVVPVSAVPVVPTVPTVPVSAKPHPTLNPSAQEFTPGSIKTPIKSAWKVPPIIIPKQEASLNPITHDKIESLITPPASPSSTPVSPSIPSIPKEPFTPTLLFEIILDNLLGQPRRYKLYLTEIKQYLAKINKIYIIDSENLRYKFIEDIQMINKNYVIIGEKIKFNYATTEEKVQSWPKMFNYLSQFVIPTNLILLCTNSDELNKKLNNYIKSDKSGKLYDKVFILNFNQRLSTGEINNFSASDDLLFWLFSMAFKLIIGESCNSYQLWNKSKHMYELTSSCVLHLITADKQKLFDPNVHTFGKVAKNFYTEFEEKFNPNGIIQFYINNTINNNIGQLIKLFLTKFIENPHEPVKYNSDPFGLKLIADCKSKKCDFFEKFMSNVKSLQKKYFPPCDSSIPKTVCAVDGNLMTSFK